MAVSPLETICLFLIASLLVLFTSPNVTLALVHSGATTPKATGAANDKYTERSATPTAAATSTTLPSPPPVDICTWKSDSLNNKNMAGLTYKYLMAGESGTIVSPAPTKDLYSELTCSIDLMSCSKCHLVIRVELIDFGGSGPAASAVPISEGDSNLNNDSAASHASRVLPPAPHLGFCDGKSPAVLILQEPPYNDLGLKRYCHESDTKVDYVSKSKWISITFSTVNSTASQFKLHYRVEENVFTLSDRKGGSLASPHFPSMYPSDFSVDYLIKSPDPNKSVRLVFSDFQLSSPWSVLDIYDTNGSRLGNFHNSLFRPPVLLSSGHNMTVRFRAGDHVLDQLTRILAAVDVGFFKADYDFVDSSAAREAGDLSRASVSSSLLPTMCGEYIDLANHGGGGAVRMSTLNASSSNSPTLSLALSSNGNGSAHVDCLWIVKPRPRLRFDEAQYFYYLSLRVAKLVSPGNETTLEIREGVHSDGKLVERLAGPTNLGTQEHIIFARVGFHIRLRGPLSDLFIIYSTFKYGGSCAFFKNFRCRNGRCLHQSLRCDGIDHCWDTSDELNCPHASMRDLDSYFFINSSSRSPANYLVLATSIAGLGMFVVTTALILVRLHRQQARDLFRTRDLFDDLGSSSEQRSETSISSDLPPSYEDVIKSCPPPPKYELIFTTAASAAGPSCSGLSSVGVHPNPTAASTSHDPRAGHVQLAVPKPPQTTDQQQCTCRGACGCPPSQVAQEPESCSSQSHEAQRPLQSQRSSNSSNTQGSSWMEPPSYASIFARGLSSVNINLENFFSRHRRQNSESSVTDQSRPRDTLRRTRSSDRVSNETSSSDRVSNETSSTDVERATETTPRSSLSSINNHHQPSVLVRLAHMISSKNWKSSENVI